MAKAKVKKEKVSVKIIKDQHQAVVEIAQKEGKLIERVVQDLLDLGLKQQKRNTK